MANRKRFQSQKLNDEDYKKTETGAKWTKRSVITVVTLAGTAIAPRILKTLKNMRES